MRKNAFTADGGPHRTSRVLDVSNGLKRMGEFEAAEMLAGYAALLRESESAKAKTTNPAKIDTKLVDESVKAAVTDGMVATFVEKVAIVLSGAPFPSARSYAKAREISDLMIEAVAPMLASARAPDEWVRRLGAPVTLEELKRAWNMIGQAHPQKEWVERALVGFIELRLAAAPKPETEE